MRINLLFLFALFIGFQGQSSVSIDSIAENKEPISHWKKQNNLGLILTQNSFVNWSSGGNNSVSGILKVKFKRDFKNQHTIWFNEFKGSFGLNKEAERGLRKTEDLIVLNSTFGYRKDTASNWYTSAKFNFRTQLANGYKYPNKEKPISKLFSPAYMFVGVGTEFTSKEHKLRIYISPVTNKTTFVLNQTLANEGAFGVKKGIYDEENNLISEGENFKMEFGTLFSGRWEKEVMENIHMTNILSMYSDYLNKYGNVDVNWELHFDMKINKYIKANVGTNIVYDDDVKQKEDIDNDGELDIIGPKIQLKQLLGVGVSYNF